MLCVYICNCLQTKPPCLRLQTPSHSKHGQDSRVYYAVAVGHVPGVYTDPVLAISQIQGFPGSVIQQCNSREEADACILKVVFYAVVVGRAPGVYTDAAVAISQTDGFPGAFIQQCASRDEAEACLRQDMCGARFHAVCCAVKFFSKLNKTFIWIL